MSDRIAGKPAAIVAASGASGRASGAITTESLNCRNCGTAFSGNFCPHCGQEARVLLPKVLDFLIEAVDETVGISGRLPRTLRLLLTRPGRLTIEYIDGRRQRYVRPMRLYLSVSLVFFGLLSIATSDFGWIKAPNFDSDNKKAVVDGSAKSDHAGKLTSGEVKDAAVQVAKDKGDDVDESLKSAGDEFKKAISGAQRDFAADKAKDQTRDSESKPPADDASSDNPSSGESKKTDDLPTSIPYLNQRFEHFKSMPKAQLIQIIWQGTQANAPYAVFVLMPLAALWYKLYYFGRGRRYAEHLLHSVHLHSFAFCVGIAAMMPFLDGYRSWLLGLMAGYVLIAERVVYSSGWIRAVLSILIGGLLYAIGIGFTAAALVIMALAF